MGEHGKGSMGDSNFLCSEYNNKVDLAADDTKSWIGNHSCETMEMAARGE